MQSAYQNRRMAARRAEYFADKACVECGSTEELELDHVDPAMKVSHRIWGWSRRRLDAELAKCQVLCRACHILKSIEEKPITNDIVPYRHGTGAMYDRHGCRCGLCRLMSKYRKRAWRAQRSVA